MNAEQEEWRPIVDWEGIYEVSSQGRVRSVSKKHFGTYHVMAQCIDRRSWDSIKDAHDAFGGHICDCLKGRRQTAAGYVWRYA